MEAVSARSLMLLAFALGQGACATIDLRPATTTQRPVGAHDRATAVDGYVVSTAQEGATATLRLSPACEQTRVNEIERTETRERVNSSPGVDWFAGLAGGALLVGGAAVYVDARVNVPDRSTNQRDYNPINRSTAEGLGVGLAAAGAALLAIPIIDAVRASGSESSVVRFEERTGSETRQACPGRWAAGVELQLAFDAPVAAGKTDGEGRLSIELAPLVPRTWAGAAQRQQKVKVMAGGKALAELDLAGAYAMADREAWAASGAQACASPQTSADCAGVERFAAERPASEQVGEARRLLSAARPVFEARADDGAWQRVDRAACERPRKVEDCEGVKAYLEAYPEGRHASEARATLAKAEKPLRSLEAAQERKAKAEAAARVASEKAAEARALADERRSCVTSCSSSLRTCQANCAGLTGGLLSDCHQACSTINQRVCLPRCR